MKRERPKSQKRQKHSLIQQRPHSTEVLQARHFLHLPQDQPMRCREILHCQPMRCREILHCQPMKCREILHLQRANLIRLEEALRANQPAWFQGAIKSVSQTLPQSKAYKLRSYFTLQSSIIRTMIAKSINLLVLFVALFWRKLHLTQAKSSLYFKTR